MRMRSLLLASVAIGALSVGVTRPAVALIPVFDSASFGELVNEAQTDARELAQLEQEVSNTTKIVGVTQQQLQQLTTFYQSFAHLTNATQIAPTLQLQSTIMPLPQLAQFEGMLRGQGFTGSLAGAAWGLLSQIQHYQPPGTDYAAQQMNSSAAATATTMAAAETLYNGANQRQQGLEQLMSGLAASQDPKQSLDIQARASIENGYAQTQGNQAADLAIVQKAQEDAQQEQAAQARRQDDDAFLSAAEANNTTVPGS